MKAPTCSVCKKLEIKYLTAGFCSYFLTGSETQLTTISKCSYSPEDERVVYTVNSLLPTTLLLILLFVLSPAGLDQWTWCRFVLQRLNIERFLHTASLSQSKESKKIRQLFFSGNKPEINVFNRENRKAVACCTSFGLRVSLLVCLSSLVNFIDKTV